MFLTSTSKGAALCRVPACSLDWNVTSKQDNVEPMVDGRLSGASAADRARNSCKYCRSRGCIAVGRNQNEAVWAPRSVSETFLE